MVLWSKQSVTSDWVVEEAEEGRKRHILVPVFIEDVLPPMGFRRIQAADLIDWDGAGTSPAFQRLVGDIAAILGPPAKTAMERVAVGEPTERKTSTVEQERKPPPVAVPPETKPSAKPPRPEPPPGPFRPSPVRKVLPWVIGIALFAGVFVAFWIFRDPGRSRVVPPVATTPARAIGETVLAPWKEDRCLYPGTVLAVEKEKWLIRFDFAEEAWAATDKIYSRRTPSASALKLNTDVYVALEGGRVWAPGKIKEDRDGKRLVVLDSKVACRGNTSHAWVTSDDIIPRQ
jgi:hypothetical protein